MAPPATRGHGCDASISENVRLGEGYGYVPYMVCISNNTLVSLSTVHSDFAFVKYLDNGA